MKAKAKKRKQKAESGTITLFQMGELLLVEYGLVDELKRIEHACFELRRRLERLEQIRRDMQREVVG